MYDNITELPIYAPVRKTVAEITFSLMPPEAKENATVDIPLENPFSRGSQILDEIRGVYTKIATFEPKYWKLDGTFALPLPKEESQMEVGWWGANMSDSNCYFRDIPTFSITFAEVQNVKILGIGFDGASGEGVEDLAVWVYGSVIDGKENVLRYKRVRGISGDYCSIPANVEGVKRVVIKLYKSLRPFRYPRLSEVDFGQFVKFTTKDIMGLSLIQEGDPTGKSFPYGELRVDIVNDGRFNQLDNTSFAPYLYQRQGMDYRHGVVTDKGETIWTYCGTYYLSDWSVDDKKVTFTTQGKSAVLDRFLYEQSSLQAISLGALAKKLVEGTGFSVVTPSSWEDIEAPKVTDFLGGVTVREGLAILAELTCSMVYENRRNHIVFVDLLEEKTEDIPPSHHVDYHVMFAPPKIKLAPYYNGIMLKEKTIKQSGTTATLEGKDSWFSAPWHDPNERNFPYVVDIPLMIVNGAASYEPLRNWFLERKFRWLAYRLQGDIRWRQNPEQEVGDTILVQGDKEGHRLAMVTYQQTLSFQGGVLKGATKTWGKSQ